MREKYTNLISEGRVHRRVYIDPQIFNAEMARIYERAWLFVAHESQLSSPGQFVATHIGHKPVIAARHSDGKVKIFSNRCSHRGMKVCNARRGFKKRFICPYHGWAYSTDGSLIGVPNSRGYNGKLDLKDPALSLEPITRIEIYRGFIFASSESEGVSLSEYLGPMMQAIDNFVDRSPSAEIELLGGGFRQRYAGNWKLHMENANDLMHASIVHASSVDSAKSVAERLGGKPENHALQMFKGNGLPLEAMDKVEIHGLPGGHSYMGAFYKDGSITQAADNDPVNMVYHQVMVDAYGEARANEILGWDTFNHLIYPNLILNPKHQQLRILQPVSVNQTIVHSMCFRLKGAPEEIFQRSIRFLSALNSPASQITTDDIAMFNGIQTALTSSNNEWIDISRGLGHDVSKEDGHKVGKVGTSELPLRSQYAAWHYYMNQ